MLLNQLSDKLPTNSRITINPKRKKDILVFATKEYHCLSDLFTRFHFDEVNANIKAVISNHDFLETYVTKFRPPNLT
jgi:formyltetrahydrofolate deformylase